MFKKGSEQIIMKPPTEKVVEGDGTVGYRGEVLVPKGTSLKDVERHIRSQTGADGVELQPKNKAVQSKGKLGDLN